MHSIEVSLDFTPRVHSEESLARMFGVLTRNHYPCRDVFENANDRPRFAWGPEFKKARNVVYIDKRYPHLKDQFLIDTDKDEPAPFDMTYWVGEKGSSPSWRTMIKTVDRQNPQTGTRLELPESEHRVRLEVTLSGEDIINLGFSTIDKLPRFRFQTLQGRYFAFRSPTFEDVASMPVGAPTEVRRRIQQTRRERFLNAGVIGLLAMDEARERLSRMRRTASLKSDQPLPARPRIGTGSNRTFLKYDELTKRAMQALRHIDDRMKV